MTLEDKFIALLEHSDGDFRMWFKANDGSLIIEYRQKWNDGLGNYSHIRLINSKLGLSTAPASWKHLVRVAALNGIEESRLNAAINYWIDIRIISAQHTVSSFKKLRGKKYVSDLLRKKAESPNIKEDIKRQFNGLTARASKPTLTLVKGDDT